jgi:translin
MPTNLSEIAEVLRGKIELQHAARERALAEGRKVIQLCSKSIKHVHRGQRDDAKKFMDEAGTIIRSALEVLEQFPTLKFAPYFQDAVKEYVEARTLFALTEKAPLPSADELGVEPQAYLNGLCEAASECRRYSLDALRRGDETTARYLAEEMEDIYDELITFDYPDALTSNLRRSVDALRAVLERTQSDLAVTGMQLELIDHLKAAKA